MALSLDQLNTAPSAWLLQQLGGLYEHSPWIAEQALQRRPFVSLAQFKHAMAQVVTAASREAQLALVRAHPELAGRAMVSQALTAESTGEQSRAGLSECSPQEFDRLQQLNSAYNERFGHPFIVAARGPRGDGLSRQQIIATFERRLHNPVNTELCECLRNIHRIAEIRLDDKFGIVPALGNEVWDWHEALAEFSDPGYHEKGQLTVTYLTQAHQACAASLRERMLACGFDTVSTDAVGNVVGRYRASRPGAPTLMTGSHFDSVRNGGKYDGRLGIFVPMACVRQLHQSQQRLPFDLELVAFSEEDGQRYKATFLGSGALVGQFDDRWLEQTDAQGISMRTAMVQAGLNPQHIGSLQRQAKDYLGFIEVHIEQGPVLNELNLPLGVVTSINGSVRYSCEITGTACHAGTTPMSRRSDAAAAAAELILYAEQRAGRDADSVATVGQLLVPNGSTNVVPGRCQFTLDMRAPANAQRDALVDDILAELRRICERRQVRLALEETMRASAAPSAPAWQARWEQALNTLGVPIHRMPSGAGHDAMKLHELMPQAMLFVRGENAGISHNPLESTTNCDMQLAIETFSMLLTQLAAELQPV